MKKYYNLIICLFIIVLLCPIMVLAGRGCCSSHGGVCGYSGGRSKCCDGSLSPTCKCSGSSSSSSKKSTTKKSTSTKKSTPKPTATPKPTVTPAPTPVTGCMDKSARNYNPNATISGDCLYDLEGCTDITADNYNYRANIDDGSCQYSMEDDRQDEDSGSPAKIIVPLAVASGWGYIYYDYKKGKKKKKKNIIKKIFKR